MKKKNKINSESKKAVSYFQTAKIPIKSDYDIAYDFSIKAYELFQPTVKSIVLFGSTAKGTAKQVSDIDIVIIVDDATILWDPPLQEWYRNKMQHLVASLKYAKKLHVHTVTLTAFYDQMLAGDPLVINVLRYGIPLIDFGGFFQPLKILLADGKIKPTRESIYIALNRAPVHLTRAHYNILGAIEAYYWAMVDASHAALMAAGKTPPSTEHIAAMLGETFVKKGMLNQKFVEWFRDMFTLVHHISHGTIHNVEHKDLAMYHERADTFIGEMASLVKKVELL